MGVGGIQVSDHTEIESSAEAEESFAFVCSLLDVDCNLPVEIIPGHFFQKASDSQIEEIREYLIRSGYFSNAGYIPYECTLEKTEKGTTRTPSKIKEEWRYYVITFKGTNAGLCDLSVASSIAPLTLEFSLTFFKEGFAAGGVGFHSWALFSHFDKLMWQPELQRVDEAELSEIGNLATMIRETEAEFPEIVRSIKMFHSLRGVSPFANLRILGMFAVIESVLSHNPKSSETGDSIAHQMRTKIPLLFRRMDKSPDYADYFDEAKESTIWKKLYDYRSSIAHGGNIDFASKLQVLKNYDTVEKFLNGTTKAILRQALAEPQLVTDLRDC